MEKQKVYLAGPFFNERETALIEAFAARLREEYEVFVPMEHTAEGDGPHGSFAWGREIYDIDVAGLRDADFVIALDHGFTSDAGTAWETGYARALGKPSYIVAVGDASPVRSVMLLFWLHPLLCLLRRSLGLSARQRGAKRGSAGHPSEINAKTRQGIGAFLCWGCIKKRYLASSKAMGIPPLASDAKAASMTFKTRRTSACLMSCSSLPSMARTRLR